MYAHPYIVDAANTPYKACASRSCNCVHGQVQERLRADLSESVLKAAAAALVSRQAKPAPPPAPQGLQFLSDC